MDLSLDDPLADILSNDSSDSFFNNEPKAKFKKPAMSTEKLDLPTVVKDSTSTARIEPNIPEFSHTKNISKTVTSSFDVSNFNLPVAATDLPKPSRNADLDSTSNFFDDLLGPIDSKRNIQTPGRSKPKSKLNEMKLPSHESIEKMEDNITGGSTLSIGLTGSRDRNRSSFNNKDVKDLKGLPNQSKKILSTDWLLFDDNKDQNKNVSKNVKSPEKQSAEIDRNSMLGNIKNSEVEAQHMLQTLNQQESHVVLAGHMRKQEQTLLEMQNKQKELLDQQESQFNKLVEKQIARHNQLEQTIRAQQERINSYLHLLMVEPLTYLPQTSKEDVKLADTKNDSSSEENDILARSKSKEAEENKLRMEHFLSSVIKNHDKEIQLLEDSHKKQINMLEVHIQHLENRLNDDMKDMEVMYIKKIEFLSTENEKIVTSYEKKLADMEEMHEEALKKVRNEYRSQMEDLKKDHKTIVDNMRNSRLSELSVFQETPSYRETLKGALNNLESATGDIKDLRDDIHTKVNDVYNQRETSLTAREKKVEDLEHHLKLQHETYEIEQKRLMELSSSLEVQLSTFNKETSEEQRILRQKISSLEAERNSFEQEKRNAREQLERQEKHIEDLRKFNLEEYNHHMQRVNEERQMVVAERKKLEIENTLNKSSNQEAMQAEFQMALKIADDAKKQAEAEHQKYLNMQRVLEIEKRKLSEKETSFQKKQDELEFSIASLKAKESYTQELYSKCQLFEQNMNVKIVILEEQMRRIMEREARVSKDRLQVAQERMELQKLKEKISETKCSLCKLTTEKNSLDQISTQMLNSPQDRAAIHASVIKIPVAEDDQFCLDSGFEFEVLQSLKRMQDTCRSGTMTVDLDAAEKLVS